MDRDLLKSITDITNPLQNAVWKISSRLEALAQMQLLALLYSPDEIRSHFADLERLGAADTAAYKALTAHGDEMTSKYGDRLSTNEKIAKWGDEYQAGRDESTRLFEAKKQAGEDFDRFRNEHPLIGAARDVVKTLRS